MSDITQMVQDPQFMALSPGDQQAALAQFDPTVKTLHPNDFAAAVKHLQSTGLSRPDLVPPPAAANNSMPMDGGDGSVIGNVANHVSNALGAVADSFGLPGSVEQIKQANAKLPQQLAHPLDTAKDAALQTGSGFLHAGDEAFSNAKNSWDNGHPVDAANHFMNYLFSPVGGGLLDKAESETDKGAYDKAVGHTLGILLPFLLGSRGEAAPVTTMEEARAAAMKADAAFKPSTPSVASTLAKDAVSSVANATTKAAYGGAKAATKYVAIPAVKGVASAIGEIAMDAAESGGKNVANKIQETLSNLGPVSDAVQAKVADMADKIKAGYVPAKSAIEQLVNDHYEQSSDAAYQGLGEIGNSIKSAAERAKQALAAHGITADVAQDVVKNATNKVRDEWTYWTNRPKSVSGGSFDADASFESALNQELEAKKITPPSEPPAVGPLDETPTPVRPSGKTPLMDLAQSEKWAESLPDGYTAGMKTPGKVETIDLRARATPGVGTEYMGKNNIFNDRLIEMYGKASVDPTLSSRAQQLFHDAYENSVKYGKANPGALASQIENGLRQPGWFQDKPEPTGPVVVDSTARMQLVKQAMDQAAKHVAATSKVQSIPAAASSLGLAGIGGMAGSVLGLPGGLAGSLGGYAVDLALKQAVKKGLIDPSNGFLSSKLIRHLADAPVIPSEGATHFKNAMSEVPKGSTDPLAFTKTKSFQRLTPQEKIAAIKYADYSKRWFSTLKSLLGIKQAPLNVPADVQVPPKVYNTAQNSTASDQQEA